MAKAYRLGLLPNGCSLFMKENEVGGRVYYSDEVGGGVGIWDTALVDKSTLLAAIVEEEKINTFFRKSKDGNLTYEKYLEFKEDNI